MPPLNKFTTKSKDAIKKAHELAIERGQNHVSSLHLLAALLLQEESMVNSILDKLEIDTRHLDYPVFLANINDPESKVGNVTEWLEERLQVVLDQWVEWLNKAELKNVEKIITKFNKEEKIKENQKSLFSKVEVEIASIKKEPEIKLKEGKSETKISKELEDLLK